MRLYGLIGYPLGHSFSQKYFSEKFAREGIADARYELFPLPNIADLPRLLEQNPGLRGLNVTIPHKEAVVPLLDDLDETARAVGAVNCIKIENQKLTGFNTDVVGFEKSLANWMGLPLPFNPTPGPSPKWEGRPRVRVADSPPVGGGAGGGVDALILGTGGASKAVAHVLKNLGVPFRFVSRHPAGENQISYEALKFIIHHSSFIINTTPLGMAPNVDTCPDLPFERLTAEHFVYDLVYNPAETLLLQRAKTQGCAVKNGLEMLHLQAEAAWEIWK